MRIRTIQRSEHKYWGLRTARTTLNNHGSGTAETPMQATYDAANRMQTLTLGTGSTASTYALTYDAEGNLTAKQNTANAADRTLYTWDAQNQLIQISQTGPQGAGTSTVTASFTYDSLGRRVQSSIQLGSNPAQTVQYVYEGAQALGEIRSGQLSHRLITGLGLDETIARVALVSSGTGAADTARSRQFLTDALNSVIAQHHAPTSGGLANSYAYSPYGQSSTVGPDATANPIQYTSRENDQTGLLFYRARYYDPVMKRFISSDPIGLAGGMNVYGYVGGDPVSYTDPEGLRSVMPQGTIYRGTGDIHGQIWVGNQMRNGAIQTFSSRQQNANAAWGPGLRSVCLLSTNSVPQTPNRCTLSNPTGASSLPASGPVISAPGQSGGICLQWGLTVGP